VVLALVLPFCNSQIVFLLLTFFLSLWNMERVVVDGVIHHIKFTERLNVLSSAFMQKLNTILDEVEATSGPAALVLSSSNPLIFR
jgi:hypothetical protein